MWRRRPTKAVSATDDRAAKRPASGSYFALYDDHPALHVTQALECAGQQGEQGEDVLPHQPSRHTKISPHKQPVCVSLERAQGLAPRKDLPGGSRAGD